MLITVYSSKILDLYYIHIFMIDIASFINIVHVYWITLAVKLTEIEL